jgi:hypothetical protein
MLRSVAADDVGTTDMTCPHDAFDYCCAFIEELR